MNRVKTDQSNLALTSTFLGYMQAALSEIQKISALGGNNFILSGCEITGTNVNSGYVVVDGELLEFKTGVLSDNFIIRESENLIEIQEGSYTYITRWCEFGVGLGQKTWSSLVRIKNLQQLETLINNEINRVEGEADAADASLQAQVTALTSVVNALFKTGMIIPFMGSAAPLGWLLCNGVAIPDNAEHAALRALVGANTPVLDGYSLTGAGTRDVGNKNGNDNIILSVAQMPTHSHEKGSIAVQAGGDHSHSIMGEIMQKSGSDTKTISVLDTGVDQSFGTRNKFTNSAGSHGHTITGNTANAGSGNSIDIRNKSMAVNFIIKI